LFTILKSLQRLLKLFKDKNVSYMIIGGYALPHYGRIRATIDLDLAVVIKNESELEQLIDWMQAVGFETTIGSPLNPLIVVVDQQEKTEIELWLRPDGIVFDGETLRRRRKVRLDANVEAWIVSPEDFIVSKLARPDRGVTDEKDVKSVLVRQRDNLDTEYLKKRAGAAGVLKVLETIDQI
jgi:hypothetical protein